MPTACILQDGCRIHLKSERLEIWRRDPNSGVEEIAREIPIREVERLILSESAHLTSPALAALMRAGVPVSLLAWSGQFLGGFLPAGNDHGAARLRQYRRTLEPRFTLELAGRIITAKLYNQRRALQRLLAARKTGAAAPQENDEPPSAPPAPKNIDFADVEQALAWLDGLLATASRSRGIDELRGYEGAATARYFQAWSAFLPAEFPFERRSTRPPLNPVNACISFGATLIYHEMVACLHAHGLDPALGLLHQTEDGRWSLALDLIEPFRPALVEPLALDLFSHQMLNAQNFEPKNGGVYLNDSGRRKFILQYERRMERQFMSECAGHRTTLRQQLDSQAVLLKSSLEEPEKFAPFLMN